MTPDPLRRLRALRTTLSESASSLLVAAGLVLEADWKELLRTPGRGRLRHGRKGAKGVVRRMGAGSYRTVTVNGKRVRRRVTRGVAMTRIDTADRASAPGDPPAPDTGALMRSVHTESTASQHLASVRTGTPMVYAEPLEFGTTTAGRKRNVTIAPRPSARPAATRAEHRMTNVVFDGVNLIVRQATEGA